MVINSMHKMKWLEICDRLLKNLAFAFSIVTLLMLLATRLTLCSPAGVKRSGTPVSVKQVVIWLCLFNGNATQV